MTWLIVVLSLSRSPDIKMEFSFSSSRYCNFALEKIVAETPVATVKGREVKTTGRKAVCEFRNA